MTVHGKKKKRHLQHLLRRHEGAPAHGLAHHKRGITFQFQRLRAAGIGALAAFFAVLGPGLLAGLSDDDPAGITTYSVLGAEHGLGPLAPMEVAVYRSRASRGSKAVDSLQNLLMQTLRQSGGARVTA